MCDNHYGLIYTVAQNENGTLTIWNEAINYMEYWTELSWLNWWHKVQLDGIHVESITNKF